MQMESLQCCDDLEGNWEDRLQEDYFISVVGQKIFVFTIDTLWNKWLKPLLFRHIDFYNIVISLLFAETDDDVQSEEEEIKEVPMSLKAVSYTHLDVYKRQDLYIKIFL